MLGANEVRGGRIPCTWVVAGGFRARGAEEGPFQSLLSSLCGRAVISTFFSTRGKLSRDSMREGKGGFQSLSFLPCDLTLAGCPDAITRIERPGTGTSHMLIAICNCQALPFSTIRPLT